MSAVCLCTALLVLQILLAAKACAQATSAEHFEPRLPAFLSLRYDEDWSPLRETSRRTGPFDAAKSGKRSAAGSTAVVFGRTAQDRQFAYVVTNGGLSLPPAGGVQPAKIVRLAIGANGYSPRS